MSYYNTAMSYEEEWTHIRERIKELRMNKGLSIQALADISDMDRASLSRIENGKVKGISLATLYKIAEALEVATGELVRK